MTITLYDTLSKSMKTFQPQTEKRVTMYVCGPTVYDFPHVGNARPAIVFDILYRLLKSAYPSVLYARNYTDIDDKIFAVASENGVSYREVTKKFIAAYREDMQRLGVLTPSSEPRVTDNINEIIKMISDLIEKKFAYIADGHVLFEVNKFQDYGKLSKRNQEQMLAGARVEVAPYKRNPADFVLWKPSKNGNPGWDSDWSYGRPGWHIECSAMSRKIFSSSIDIHGGGMDLIFPHHENEIAQSECAFHNEKYANYWVHNGHVTIDGQKMSKSLGNIIRVRDLLKKEPGEVVRFALISTHYRQPLDWTSESLQRARQSLDKIYRVLMDFQLNSAKSPIQPNSNRIKEALSSDVNTPEALSVMFKVCKEIKNSKKSEGRSELLQELRDGADLLGLLKESPDAWLKSSDSVQLDENEIMKYISRRNEARRNKDFKTADKIRDQLIEKNILLKDGTKGTDWELIEK
ncbi:MAG: cysteine--tRNA ligase [Pseudomonadota bacterium]|nr:cysteine--tRNA ligase [Pseudomonadota bacterium]